MFKLEKYGQLKIDKVFFEANYPILFTCVNEKQKLFLCVCCQNNAEGTKWLLTETKENIVIDMLKDKVSIREAFLKNPNSQITIFYNNEIEIREFDENDWGDESIYLPKENEFIEAEENEFDEEIDYYQNKIKEKECVNLIIKYNNFFDKLQTLNHLIDDSEVINYITTEVIERKFNINKQLSLEELTKQLLLYFSAYEISKDMIITKSIYNSKNKEAETIMYHIEKENDSYLMAA